MTRRPVLSTAFAALAIVALVGSAIPARAEAAPATVPTGTFPFE